MVISNHQTSYMLMRDLDHNNHQSLSQHIKHDNNENAEHRDIP